MNMAILLSVIFAVLMQVTVISSECNFPKFLQSPQKPDSTDLDEWITERIYKKDRLAYESERTIAVDGGKMFSSISREANSTHDGQTVIAIHKELKDTYTCLEDKGDGIFWAEVQENFGNTKYKCMKFIERSSSIVEVKTGPDSITSDSTSCEDSILGSHEIWPWIAPASKTRTWNYCPFSGGFDFTTTDMDKKILCPTQWRPARFESECFKGEGVDFIYPEEKCNPFGGGRTDVKMYCQASWEDGDYLFLVLSEPGEYPPKYSMRFPKERINSMEPNVFTTHLYFGVVITRSLVGTPREGVNYLLMSTKRTSSDLCYDVSDTDCPSYSDLNMCDQYGESCQKSCDMCDKAPSIKKECDFAENIRGEWIQQQQHNTFSISINQTHFHSSDIGTYICKEQKWESAIYKVISAFQNGCRPRYSCLEFNTLSKKIIQYHISPSQSKDKGLEEICEFTNDPEPLSDTFRSTSFKNLISKTAPTSQVTCGLTNLTKANATFKGSRSCFAFVGEWDPVGCKNSKNNISVVISSEGNCSVEPQGVKQEFNCIARHELENKDVMIITENVNSKDSFLCWILTNSTPDTSPWTKGRVLYQMPSPQCGKDTRTDVFLPTKAPSATYKLFDDTSSQTCGLNKLHLGGNTTTSAGKSNQGIQIRSTWSILVIPFMFVNMALLYR